MKMIGLNVQQLTVCNKKKSNLSSFLKWLNDNSFTFNNDLTAAVAQSVGAFASLAEGLVFESQRRQAEVIKTGSDSSTAKLSAKCASVSSPRK